MSLAEVRSARERAHSLLRDKIDPADKKRADQDERRREQLAAEQRVACPISDVAGCRLVPLSSMAGEASSL